MNIYKILFFIANILGLVPLLLFYSFKGRFSDSNFKGIVPFIWLVAIASFYEVIFSHFLKVNVEIWFKIYSFVEFILIVILFSGQKNRPNRYYFWIFTVIYLMVFTFLLFACQACHFLKQDSFLNVVLIFFIISYATIWFYKNFKIMENNSLLELPFFYFLSGLLVYYSGIIFLSLLSESIVNSPLYFFDYWIVHICFLILFRILLIVSVWKGRTK